jgi:hypothetical protein
LAQRCERPGPQAQPEPKAGFTVRYRAVVYLNASPEPVRRGAYVALTASVTDGWEYFDPHPIRLYFRRAGTTAWRYFDPATPHCIEICDEGEATNTATRRFRQTVSGTWKAVSQRTSYLESGLVLPDEATPELLRPCPRRTREAADTECPSCNLPTSAGPRSTPSAGSGDGAGNRRCR